MSARCLKLLGVGLMLALHSMVHAQPIQKVIDIPTRAGVTQRILFELPPNAKAAVVLFAGGNGGLQIFPNGSMTRGESNFLVRSRQLFVERGLAAAVIDAPSDRQLQPYLDGFRQRPEHAADVAAVIRWLRDATKVPVWLVGTSRGTQSVAYVATELKGTEGPDGIVLTSTMLKDNLDRPVPALPLANIRVPVLVVHHENDGCRHCAFVDMPNLMDALNEVAIRELITFKGGQSKGDPCQAFAYHGFNGLEAEVVEQIVTWILAKKPG